MATPDVDWFKVSRRVLKSSRWWMEPPSTFKVLLFLLAEAQAIDNPHPGEVHMGATVIAGQCNLPIEDVRAALRSLEAVDDESQTRADKRTIEALQDGGGYRLVNFELYHPHASAKAEWRSERARKAANARWAKSSQPECSIVDFNAPGVQVLHYRATEAPTVAAILAPGSFSRANTVLDARTGERRPSYVGDSVYPTKGDRDAAEREANDLSRAIADDRAAMGYVDLIDPVAVIAEASSFRGESKLRVDLMSNERLWHTINNPENGLRAGARRFSDERSAKGL